MSFELEITFIGMIVFVPIDSNGEVIYEPYATNNKKPDYVWALLINAENPPTDANKKVIDSHFSALRYQTANVAKGPDRIRLFWKTRVQGLARPWHGDHSPCSGRPRPSICILDFLELVSVSEIINNV